MPEAQRRLAAIMYTDIAGFTPLGQRNESLSLAVVQEHRSLVRPILARHGGREVKTMGDAFLVEFASAVEGVRCAYDIQRANREYNFSLGEDRRINVRIGMHLGEVVEDQGDILGDAVNVASRIEKLAKDGGVCLTSQVHDHVQGKVDLRFVNLGNQSLKGVSAPLEVFRVAMPWEDQGTGPARGLDPKRVAVLPFTNMSPDPNDEYFADGMTEELIDRLAQVKGLEVIARTSVMEYKKKGAKATNIAKDLDVGSLVEGSVRKAGNRVRVTAQLINGSTEGHLWSSHYDKNLDDIFEVQSEIAEKVAGELKAQLLDSERRELEKKPTENTEAYSLFLRGRDLVRKDTEASAREALTHFERAVELDPSFARAYVGVAECHQWLYNREYERQDAAFKGVKASLSRALVLDPNLPEAYVSLSTLRFNEGELLVAEKEARRAVELNPSLPDAYEMLGEVAGAKGEPETMVKMFEAAYRLDPIRPACITQVGWAYFLTGKEQQALEHWKKTEHLAPAGTYKGMAEYHLSKGEIGKARELHAKVVELAPADRWAIWMEGYMDAQVGEKEKAFVAIGKLEEAKAAWTPYEGMAKVYLALGDLDRYYENMDRALDVYAMRPVEFLYSPLLARAREDPRYGEFLTKMRKMTGLA